MKKLTPIEIIDETVEYYKTHPRAQKGKTVMGCEYKTADGRMCAVGRCFTEKALEEFENYDGAADDLFNSHIGFYDVTVFKPEYRINNSDISGFEYDAIRFWEDLQFLHDWPHHWIEESPESEIRELSERGVNQVKRLKMRYR